MPVFNLEQSLLYFNMNKVYEDRISYIEEVVFIKPLDDTQLLRQLNRLEEAKAILAGEAKLSLIISSLLNHISWKHNLVKYDILNNGEDIIIHFEYKSDPPTW